MRAKAVAKAPWTGNHGHILVTEGGGGGVTGQKSVAGKGDTRSTSSAINGQTGGRFYLRQRERVFLKFTPASEKSRRATELRRWQEAGGLGPAS